ncbi:leukemia inhibitory factor receptor-like isoform X2 [Thunnus albacares]|uniref:leukemia inhibitory factor receptor-like isoform X2 n=1 Tax=Thunnus albacares TaxID=8236 RepID=UPI001CF63634|nr:leukemia inhibitory factor receptor-like isoform X2 [Thunnus albacares]
MIIWILLLSLFCESTQDGNGKENGVLHCEPQNMRLTTPDQKILLTWEDDPSCLAVHDVLMYEVVVLIADQQVHNDTFAVTPDQIGSTHSWNWKPHLPLECASHSVRLSSRYKNRTSPWKQEQTHPGNPKTPEVFPRDRVFKVGSRATFCCVVPVGDTFDRMDISRYSGTYMNTTKISNQTYALTINLDQASNTYCTDVKCHTKTQENGACAYIGYPPDDSNLLCETRDLQSVECLWTVGNDTRVKNETEYHLLGRYNETILLDVAIGWSMEAKKCCEDLILLSMNDPYLSLYTSIKKLCLASLWLLNKTKQDN